MIRRISTKLVLAVLTAVVLPFVAYAFYVDSQIADRLTRHVVQQALMGLAKDLAGQVDYFVDERLQDLVLLSQRSRVLDAIDEHTLAMRRIEDLGGSGASDSPVWDAETLSLLVRGELTTENFESRWMHHRSQLTQEFDTYIGVKSVYDVMLFVDAKGRLVTCSGRHPDGKPLDLDYLEALFERDYAGEEWYQLGLAGRDVRVNQHVSPYRLPEVGDGDPDWGYHLGFAVPVQGRHEPDKIVGVVYGLVNWHFVQRLVGNEVVSDAFRGLVDPGDRPSAYAWIWDEDGDTILAHPDRRLYQKSVSRDVELPQLSAAVQGESWGLFPEYTFRGKEKNAAFKRCRSPEEGGFGWVAAVGIDNDDIYATAEELRTLLLGGTFAVLLMAAFWTVLIARRTTEPIRALQGAMRQVTEGDLSARAAVQSQDELGTLTQDFNRMAAELEDQRARIVKAEKDAAWREMARQIAHDIKNPLTPISLSLDLLERVRRERPEGSEEVLDRTMGLIRRQVQNLRQIAGDFYEFTGGQKPNVVRVDVRSLVDEVLHLHDAWAVELGVDMQREGPTATVLADLGKLRRVFVNLVSNALQAMPDGGRLLVETAVEGDRVRVTFRDTGEGIPEEAREHLFEPYFTTRSEGTGLGLAISKQVTEQMGGEITLAPAPDGEGTIATVRLPIAREFDGDGEGAVPSDVEPPGEAEGPA